MMQRDPRFLKTKAASPLTSAGALCAPWATLLPDAAEGLLSDAEQRALDHHLAGCATCSEELAEAQRGLAWLTVLKEQAPAPPMDLLANVLAQTTGMEETGAMLPAMPLLPAASPGLVKVEVTWDGVAEGLGRWMRGDIGTWSGLLQPRLAMTAAMAFFSICLSLNLFGISVTRLDAQSFRTGGLQHTVDYGRASLFRSIQGLRVVYRVESRVNEMRAQMQNPGDPAPVR